MAAVSVVPGWAQHPPRVYSHLMNPREHPDDTRRHVRPPDWNTFGNRTQFTSLRGFEDTAVHKLVSRARRQLLCSLLARGQSFAHIDLIERHSVSDPRRIVR